MDGTAIVLAAVALVMPITYAWRDAVKAKAVALERLEDRALAAATAKAVVDASTAAGERAKVTATAALDAAAKVSTELAAQSAGVSAQLTTIHDLVNSQLTEAVDRWRAAMKIIEQMTADRLAVTTLIEEMRSLLLEKAPKDPRVLALIVDKRTEAKP